MKGPPGPYRYLSEYYKISEKEIGNSKGGKEEKEVGTGNARSICRVFMSLRNGPLFPPFKCIRNGKTSNILNYLSNVSKESAEKRMETGEAVEGPLLINDWV